MSILTPGTGTPKTFLFFWSAVRPSSTPPATPIAPVTAGIATCVIVSRTELFSSLPPLLDAACAASAALLFAPSAVLRALLGRLREDRLDALADLLDPLPERLDPLPERLDPLPERLDPLRARLDAPPELLAPLLDPLDPFADVRPRDELRLEDLRELVAAILLTSDTRNTTPAVPVLSQLQAGDEFGLPTRKEFRSPLDGCSRAVSPALHR
jgi:hypothetical protein